MTKKIAPNTLLQDARAEAIPAGSSGLWFITKVTTDTRSVTRCDGRDDVLPPGTYTHLFRVTEGTLHQEPPGTCVMEDTPFELKKHLSFMLQAHGRVLVTGLGLGCVVRGLLANPNVGHVTCIERSSDVLKLVEPYMPEERLTIIQADALEWTKINKEFFTRVGQPIDKGGLELKAAEAAEKLKAAQFNGYDWRKAQAMWEVLKK